MMEPSSHHALARVEGDTPLLASLRNVDVGGPNCSELDTLTSLGIGIKVSSLVDRDRRINDVTIKMVRIQPIRVYVVSDPTLKLTPNKTKAGLHGPDIVVAD